MQNGNKMEKEPITIEGLKKLKIELIFLKEKKKFTIKRDKKNPTAGPFEKPGNGVLKLKVWLQKREPKGCS